MDAKCGGDKGLRHGGGTDVEHSRVKVLERDGYMVTKRDKCDCPRCSASMNLGTCAGAIIKMAYSGASTPSHTLATQHKGDGSLLLPIPSMGENPRSGARYPHF